VNLRKAPPLTAVELERVVRLAVQAPIADLEQGLADLDERGQPALDDVLEFE
jgi:hypothetical protein